jgi:hypothetical protein
MFGMGKAMQLSKNTSSKLLSNNSFEELMRDKSTKSIPKLRHVDSNQSLNFNKFIQQISH